MMATPTRSRHAPKTNIKNRSLFGIESKKDSLELYDKLATLLQPFDDITRLTIPRIVVIGTVTAFNRGMVSFETSIRLQATNPVASQAFCKPSAVLSCFQLGQSAAPCAQPF